MKSKKLLSVLLALAMMFSLTITAGAEETAKTMEGSVVILHTNDVHGAIGSYAKVAALKDDYEAKGAYVLLMDAGDFSQGDPTVSVSEGATAVEMMIWRAMIWQRRATMSSTTGIPTLPSWQTRPSSPW